MAWLHTTHSVTWGALPYVAAARYESETQPHPWDLLALMIWPCVWALCLCSGHGAVWFSLPMTSNNNTPCFPPHVFGRRELWLPCEKHADFSLCFNLKMRGALKSPTFWFAEYTFVKARVNENQHISHETKLEWKILNSCVTHLSHSPWVQHRKPFGFRPPTQVTMQHQPTTQNCLKDSLHIYE